MMHPPTAAMISARAGWTMVWPSWRIITGSREASSPSSSSMPRPSWLSASRNRNGTLNRASSWRSSFVPGSCSFPITKNRSKPSCRSWAQLARNSLITR